MKDIIAAHLDWVEKQGKAMLETIKEDLKEEEAVNSAAWVGFAGGWYAALTEEKE